MSVYILETLETMCTSGKLRASFADGTLQILAFDGHHGTCGHNCEVRSALHGAHEGGSWIPIDKDMITFPESH